MINHKVRMLRHNPQFISFSLDKDVVYKNLFPFHVANVGDPDRWWASQSIPCLMSLPLWQHISYLSRTVHCLKNASLYSDTSFPVLSQLITNKNKSVHVKIMYSKRTSSSVLIYLVFSGRKEKVSANRDSFILFFGFFQCHGHWGRCTCNSRF